MFRALLILILIITGCSTRPRSTAQSTTQPTTRPSLSAAQTPLAHIEPMPRLSDLTPATKPTTRPSLQALHLYAQARAHQHERNLLKAIDALRRASELDPASPEIHYALASAYISTNSSSNSDRAIQHLQRAAALLPDSLDTQLQLGRQYIAKGNYKKAIEHLRLALQTTEYPQRDESAAVVNLLLARALHREGFDTAALGQYNELLRKITGRLNVRGHPDLYFIMSRPEWIHMQIGQLSEKHGNHAAALEHYQVASSREPNNFDFQSHIVSALLGLKRNSEARALAAELVSGHRASPDSVDLLRTVYKRIGKESEVIPELQRIMKDRPGDRSIAFALAESLNTAGRGDEAKNLLVKTLNHSKWDSLVVARLFDLHLRRSEKDAAARLVIDALIQRPDSSTELHPLWHKLIRGPLKHRLNIAALQNLEVSPDAQASKLFWLSRAAELQNRDALARASLEKAVALEPPFAPAYRELLGDIFSRPESTDAEKQSAAQKLIDRAQQSNQKHLAAELRGRLALHRKNIPAAIAALDESIKLGSTSPTVHYALAASLITRKEHARAEQILWKIVGEWPSFDDAYLALFQRYLERGGPGQALKILQNWLVADPQSTSARLLQINVFMQQDRLDAAEQALTRLVHDEPHNPLVLAQASQFFTTVNRPSDFQKLLEEEHTQAPDNRAAAEFLVTLYSQQARNSDALRTLDATRAAVAADPDELYYIAHLYDRLDQKQTSEQVLADVLKIDPKNVPASNDLGYLWADSGKNLAEAEAMIRHAITAEPDNGAYLDSLGWVLYKRGKFDEAHQHLNQAIRRLTRPDPVVLDHLGDVLYRLNQPKEALKNWKLSLNRLDDSGPDRDDLKTLKLQLRNKIRQQESGQPVSVAPIAESREPQVKNEDRSQ